MRRVNIMKNYIKKNVGNLKIKDIYLQFSKLNKQEKKYITEHKKEQHKKIETRKRISNPGTKVVSVKTKFSPARHNVYVLGLRNI